MVGGESSDHYILMRTITMRTRQWTIDQPLSRITQEMATHNLS